MHRSMVNSLAAVVVAGMWMSAGLRGQKVTLPSLAGPVANAAAAPAAPVGPAPMAPLVALGEARVAPGDWLMRDEAARRALQLGFSPAAEALLKELGESPEASESVKNRLGLELTGALLDQGRLADAEQTLARIPGARGAAYHLRAGLIAAYRKQTEPARSEAAQVKVDELPAAERGWFRFLEGMIADQAGDLGRRDQAYEEAIKSAVSDLQRARFELEQQRVKLLSVPATEQDASRLRQNMERLQGQKTGYVSARYYAVALDALGRKPEAVRLLQRQLQSLPPEERQEADDLRLLLGLIGGADSGLGRNALFGLLDRAVSREPQRAALQLLARGSDTGAARAELRAKLDQLIAAPAPHPIKEELLVYRAQAALFEKNYSRAEEDAKTLLESFPGSQLKTQALGVLTSVAWELRRYRTAADDAAQLRAELPAGDARAQLGVLVADAYFRAGDFRNAADAYGSAQREPPAAVASGVLLFQRVLAEINAAEANLERLDAAQALLDDAAATVGVDPVNRWQAEWNLARALQVHGRTAPALKRVTRLLGQSGAAALSPDLFVRMAWLQARLAFESGSAAEAIRLVDALLEAPAIAKLAAGLRTDVISTSILLKAQALLDSSKTEPAAAKAGLDLLTTLRNDYAQTDAAIYSYIAEANHYLARNVIVEAQGLFTKLADTYPDSTYAPFALYEAARSAERLGQDAAYEDADRLIERLVTSYPQSDLVFYARLKQGDLLRKLNDFGRAQRAYEEITNKFPAHQDVLLAQLALAECHYAQAASDPSHWESAVAIYERLQDLPTAPVDLRVEAGFNHGNAQAKRGATDRAQAAWMLVINTVLLDPARAAELGAKGRYWMSRVLLELGGLYEKQAKLDQARSAYELLLRQQLPGGALAQQRLERFSAGKGGEKAKPE